MKRLSFEPRVFKLYRIPPEQQRRMDELADKCNEGKLTKKEHEEYAQLVEEAQHLTLENAKTLVQFEYPELFDLDEQLKLPKRKKRHRSNSDAG